MSFHSPHLLWLLVPLLIPFCIWLWRHLPERSTECAYTNEKGAKSVSPNKSWRPVLLLGAGSTLVILSLAGPTSGKHVERNQRIPQKIVLVVDLSASMLIEDFARDGERRNRLEASKSALTDYLATCSGDSVGLVVFTAEASSVVKLTPSTKDVVTELEQLTINRLKDGTAIGDAIDLALTFFPNTPEDNYDSAIILLSDGADNRSRIQLAEAAQKAANQAVAIHTIGIGGNGIAPVPVYSESGELIGYRRAFSEFDDSELTDVANFTGGSFFRAIDSEGIFNGLRRIRAQQDNDVHAKLSALKEDLTWEFALPGIGLFVAGGLLKFSNRPKAYLPAA